MKKRVVIAITMLAAVGISTSLLWKSRSFLQQGPKESDSRNAVADARLLSTASQAGGAEGQARLVRPSHYQVFDFSSILRAALVEASLGSADAQYRASVLLRDCRGTPVDAGNAAALSAKGVDEGHIALLKSRTERCRGIHELLPSDPYTVSQQLAAASLQQGFPIAVINHLVMSEQSLRPDEIDENLRAALASADTDRALRYETFFLVLAAMDVRSSASGIEADSTVRNAWTLLHCRESWECDFQATIDALALEMPESGLQLTIDLASDLDATLARGDFSNIPLY